MDWNKASAELAKPLDGFHVKGRKQGGRTVNYIESWRTIDEANRIFGFDGWSSETVEIKCVAEKPRAIGSDKREGWGVSYTAKVRVTVGDLAREGVGAGHGIDVDLGLAHESAIKEAESDARKRALITFGNPFGLALYDKEQTNVTDEREHKAAEPAPPAPAPSKAWAELKDSIGKIEDITSLDTWTAKANEAKQQGLLRPSETLDLRSRLEARRSYLAQAPKSEAA